MGALPVVGIITAIAAIVAALIYWATHTEQVNSAISGLWDKYTEKVVAQAEAEHAASVAKVTAWQETLSAAKAIQNEMVASEEAAANERITNWQTTLAAAKQIQDSMVADERAATNAKIVAWQNYFASVQSSFASWGQSMRNQTASIMDSLRSTLSSGLERAKSLFNFSWSLPHIALPHFSISGSFSLKPPSVPKFSVSWYQDGGILYGAQLFGKLGSKLLGGGEAGPEAVLPLSKFYHELESILGKQRSSTSLVVQVDIEHFENSSGQDVESFVQEVAQKLQHELEIREVSFA
jgi:hypothetical protein